MQVKAKFNLKITWILEMYHINLIVISRNIYLALFIVNLLKAFSYKLQWFMNNCLTGRLHFGRRGSNADFQVLVSFYMSW